MKCDSCIRDGKEERTGKASSICLCTLHLISRQKGELRAIYSVYINEVRVERQTRTCCWLRLDVKRHEGRLLLLFPLKL